MIPLYGFVEGDTLGLLVLASPEETVGAVARRMATMASLRVAPVAGARLVHRGITLAPETKLSELDLAPLDRIDLVGGAS